MILRKREDKMYNQIKEDDIVWIKEHVIPKHETYSCSALGKKFGLSEHVVENIYANRTYQNIKCSYTLFVCSDIHGECNTFIRELRRNGFNENKYNHKLIVCGDIFDRGRENLDVFMLLKKLEDAGRAIILSGNHDKFLIDYLTGKSVSPFNYIHNGTDETLGSFLTQRYPFEMWCTLNDIDKPTQDDFKEWIEHTRNVINESYPDLLPWLQSRPRYYETENYIFVHGAIDTDVDDWKKPKKELYGLKGWDALDFDDGSFFGKNINNTEKTVVIGHFGTKVLREMYGYDFEKRPNEILKRKDGRIIAVDSTINSTRDLNVLKIEKEHLILD